MKDCEYLEKLFTEYLPTLNAMNEATTSFYSKDEYKMRHRMFKQIYSKYRRYRLSIFKEKIKKYFSKFKIKKSQRKAKKIINDYNKLKEEGCFLPKKLE